MEAIPDSGRENRSCSVTRTAANCGGFRGCLVRCPPTSPQGADVAYVVMVTSHSLVQPQLTKWSPFMVKGSSCRHY